MLDGTNGTNITSGIEIPGKGCSVKNVTVVVNVGVVDGTIVVNPMNVTVLANGMVTLTLARRYVEDGLRNRLDVLGFARDSFQGFLVMLIFSDIFWYGFRCLKFVYELPVPHSRGD